MGLLDVFGGGSQETTTKTAPWKGVAPYLRDLFSQAQSQVAQKPQEYYPGQTVAGFTGPQLQAQQGTLGFAQNYKPAVLPQAQGATNWLTSGQALSPQSNPWLAQTAQTAIDPVTRALREQVLPQIQQQAVMAGQFGGGRQGVVENQAIQDWLRQAADTSAGIYSTGYGQGLEALQRGVGLAPGLETAGQQSGLFPYTLQSAVGGQQQAMNQAQMEDQLARWNFAQQEPYNRLNQYSVLLNPGTNFQTTTTNTGASSGAGLQGLIGAGLGAASLWSLMNPATAPLALQGGNLMGAGAAPTSSMFGPQSQMFWNF